LRQLTQTLALFALFANIALLPTLHVSWGQHPSRGEAVHHSHQNSNEPAALNHQVCHFCRFLGAALPPPPTIVIEVVSASQIIEWPPADPSIRPEQLLRSANLPRAPPLSS
jgi:hypothetical protein